MDRALNVFNVFGHQHQSLQSIVTKDLASSDIQDFLLKDEEYGKTKVTELTEESLVNSNSKDRFNASIKHNKA